MLPCACPRESRELIHKAKTFHVNGMMSSVFITWRADGTMITLHLSKKGKTSARLKSVKETKQKWLRDKGAGKIQTVERMRRSVRCTSHQPRNETLYMEDKADKRALENKRTPNYQCLLNGTGLRVAGMNAWLQVNTALIRLEDWRDRNNHSS